MLTGEFSKMRGSEHACLHNAVHSSHKPSYAIGAKASLLTRSVLGDRLLQKQLPGPCARPEHGTRVRWLVFPADAWQSGLVEQGYGKDKEVHGRNTDEVL